MTVSVPKRGYDAWVDSAHIHATHGAGDWMQLLGAQKYGFLWMPYPSRMRGRTVGSALLTGHAGTATAAQTLTFYAAAAKWEAAEVTYSNKPGVTGTPVTVAVPALAAGQEFTVNLATLLQPVADGTVKNFGWRVSTNAVATQKLATFDSGATAWTLTIEFDEDPEAPTAFAPNGTVVSAAKPVVTFDFTEYGATDSDLASVRVEVDLNNDGIVDWDSGWVAAVAPKLDLAAAGMTGTVSAGATVKWRAYVKDQSGRASAASDWATYTYQPLGTGTLLTPAAGVLYDPTSEVIAQLSGQTLAAFRMWVTDGDDQTRIRYDSGKIQASDPALASLELPLKNSHRTRIFTDDDDYQLHVRLFDTLDREATPGAPAYVDIWATVHFDDDGALAKITSLQSAQVDETPFVRLTWTDAAAADAYLVSRDGVQIARLDPADIISGVSAYTWVDMAAAPAVQHIYDVRRLTVGVGKSPSRQTSVRVDPEGIWFLRQNGDFVVLDGDGVDQLRSTERSLRYNPINLQHAVKILTQYDGLSGPLAATIEDAEDQSVRDAKRVLDAIKLSPSEPVQMIYATVSKPVLVSQLSVDPDPEYRDDMNRHTVNCFIDQVGDFDYRVS